MATLPDKGTGDSDIQSIVFKEFIEAMSDGISGLNCVLSGCAITGGATMTPSVAKGAVLTNGVLKPVTAGTVTISAAHATLPRLDLIVVDSTGTKQVRTGTAAAAPKPPARTANDVVLACVYVPALDTAIATTQIIDWRFVRLQGPIVIAKSTTPVTQNTLATIFTLASVTIPNGLFLAGRVLRMRMGGNYLSNSGAPTWTFTISYGGVTFIADATAATTADADRGSWDLEFDLYAVGNALQRIDGHLRFQSPGAKNAPATGTAGDFATVADVNADFNYTGGTVDSDAADRILLVQCTMSVSNVAVETVMDGYTLELL